MCAAGPVVFGHLCERQSSRTKTIRLGPALPPPAPNGTHLNPLKRNSVALPALSFLSRVEALLSTQAPAGGIPFQVHPHSLVWSRKSLTAVPLKKLHADTYPSALSVLGHEAFTDRMPRELKPTKDYHLMLGPEALAIWNATSDYSLNKNIRCLFIIELEDKKSRLNPAGIALVNLAQQTVQASWKGKAT